MTKLIFGYYMRKAFWWCFQFHCTFELKFQTCVTNRQTFIWHWNCRTRKCKTGNRKTKSQDLKMTDMENDGKIARLENGGHGKWRTKSQDLKVTDYKIIRKNSQIVSFVTSAGACCWNWRAANSDARDNGTAAVFASDKQLELQNVTHICFDATFKVVPLLYCQFFTMFVLYADSAFPVIRDEPSNLGSLD